MTEKINGQGFRPTDVGTRRSDAAKSTTSNTLTAEGGHSPSARANDTVNLTQSGKLMVRLEEIVRNTPAVDIERVNSIKDALADGSYRFDDQRVADQMLRAQRELLS